MKFREGVVRWVMLVVLLGFSTAHATGPSSAEIEIVPLAVNGQGVVLCKTESHINLMGAQSLKGMEYGWLAISADGVWDEQLENRIDEKEAEGGDRLDTIMHDYAQRTDLHAPPPSLRRMMERYGFTENDTLKVTQPTREVTWDYGRLCAGPRCLEEKVAQRTLKGITSIEEDGSPVKAHFVAAGVALFANKDYTGVDEGQQGAIFGVVNMFQGHDIGVDLQAIIGIVFLPPSLRSSE